MKLSLPLVHWRGSRTALVRRESLSAGPTLPPSHDAFAGSFAGLQNEEMGAPAFTTTNA